MQPNAQPAAPAQPAAIIQGDGGYDDAILGMDGLDELDVHDDPRDEPVEAKPDKPEPEKAEKPEVEAKPEAPEADDDDYIELPAETEGAQPTRVKLDEVLTGWKESATLKQQLAEARQSAPQLPHEIVEQVTALQSERVKYQRALETWAQQNQPQKPSMEMLNPASREFDTDGYYIAYKRYEQGVRDMQSAAAEHQRLTEQTTAEQEAMRKSRISREQAEVAKIWPEVLADEKLRVAAKQQLMQHYKIDDAFLNSDVTLDHRIYALAKDALAYRALQGKQAEVAKAVKAKPKLIQGQARSKPSTSSARGADGFKNLRQSGSLDDAADALDGLL